MASLEIAKVETYLKSLFGKGVKVLALTRLGDPEDKLTKGFGYGVPVRVDYESAGERKKAVLHTMSPGPFGHEHMADRARVLLWSHQAFNKLPRHVRSLDVGAFRPDGTLMSLAEAEELCLLTDYVDGQSYVTDLERLRDTGELTELDLSRADTLCDYLVDIHKARGPDPSLYVRRNRELLGDGECIMGLTDSYPTHPLFPPEILEEIEHRAVEWRWRLKDRTNRLRQIHGDFHPWNILFGSGVDFHLLDRSRGEFGDPADDLTSLTMNYLFFSLQRSERLEGGFEKLFLTFWERYLAATKDCELLRVAAPYFAFRGLVMASPLWYPNLSNTVRKRLRQFILAVLQEESFDPTEVNAYCGG